MSIAHKGIKNLSELVIFAVTLVGALRKANEDGKIGVGDAFKLWPAVKAAPDAFRDIGEVPKELADIDPTEADELVQLVETHFGEMALGRRTADVVDATLAVIPALANLYMTIANPPPVAQPA